MFDIGFWELLVVGLVGLLVLGPERLPKAIRSLQATTRKVRQFGSRMEAEINHELRVKELHENLKKVEQAEDLDSLPDDLKESLAQLQRAAASVNRPYAKSAQRGHGEPAQQHQAPEPNKPQLGSTQDIDSASQGTGASPDASSDTSPDASSKKAEPGNDPT